jgi:membrane protein insertase Oxa1/YidC/SpoIIIJ
MSLQVSILTFITRSLTFTFLTSALLEQWCQMLQAEMQRLQQRQEALLAERDAERAEREAEQERMQALEAQTQGLLAFVQQLGEQQGWQILAQLLAPPRLPPPPR